MSAALASGFDALPSFDRINLSATLLQTAVIIAFAAAQHGAAQHFNRPAMRRVAMVWRLYALAAFVNIFSSWAGAIWSNRPLSRLLTSVVVGLTAAAIPYAWRACRDLVGSEPASLGDDSLIQRWSAQVGVGVFALHVAAVFSTAAIFPTLRVVPVTSSRVLDFLALLIPTVVAWRASRAAREKRVAVQLLATAFTSLAVRQLIAVGLGLRVGMPDLPFAAVVAFVIVDILSAMIAGACTLLATTAEEVTIIQAQSAELARTQERLAGATRMESLGRMATGIAHDINNVLQVIGLSTELLSETSRGQRVLRDDAPTLRDRSELRVSENELEARQQLDSAMSHARSLTSQLLTFARARPTAASRFDPADRLQGIRALLTAIAGQRLELTVLPAVHGAALVMDPAQFEQLVINLVSNARDAVGVDGRIRVQLDLVGVSPEFAAADALTPGTYVRLKVEDTGEGIAPDIQAQIFEPFFTTKQAGHGTGLGLATVHGIARQASGVVHLESELGRGTVFEVLLPAA